jgi:hypothetical protein
MDDFADLLAHSVFATKLPRPASVATQHGYRAVVFEEPHTDIVDDRDLVGSRCRVTVSCCLCLRTIRLAASGYGEMAREVRAAGWHCTPGRHLHERAWCPQRLPNAGKAVD